MVAPSFTRVRDDAPVRALDRTLAREAALTAGTGAVVAAALAWLAPPGADLAAHAYQRTLFLEHGFALWNNFWYAGRYSFVTYSLLYYPLAAVVGIRLLAVATVAVGALAFAVLVAREWGTDARWAWRTFAVVWAGMVLTAAYPFALGMTLALLALLALQAGRSVRFSCFAVLTVAASPLAFLLLSVVLAAVVLERRPQGIRLLRPAAVVVVIGLCELLLWRAFPDGGRYPFPTAGLAAACTFCIIGMTLTWRVDAARLLRFVFTLYLLACLASFLIPSSIGENVARLRFAAIPIAVLALSLRKWRPLPVALVAFGLAVSWNLSPLAANVLKASSDPSADAAYWRPAITFLKAHLTPAYRVEAVDTVGHWPAFYLAQAELPLARGWYRQDDFPQNDALYGRLGERSYLSWLRRLGVRYVVVAKAPPDYSAKAEQRLIDSGRSGLHRVLRTPTVSIFAVPGPVPIVVGPGHPRVLDLRSAKLVLRVSRAGSYRIGVRWSPYWHSSNGCLSGRRDGMIRFDADRAGTVVLRFSVDAGRALETVAGASERACGDE
jgi:hypothetical protein